MPHETEFIDKFCFVGVGSTAHCHAAPFCPFAASPQRKGFFMYYNPIECGIRIRQLRQKCGFSQEQFSEKLNISRNYLAKIETGIRQPSIDLWIDIAILTGTTLDYLILGKNSATEAVKEKLQETISVLSYLQEVL